MVSHEHNNKNWFQYMPNIQFDPPEYSTDRHFLQNILTSLFNSSTLLRLVGVNLSQNFVKKCVALSLIVLFVSIRTFRSIVCLLIAKTLSFCPGIKEWSVLPLCSSWFPSSSCLFQYVLLSGQKSVSTVAGLFCGRGWLVMFLGDNWLVTFALVLLAADWLVLS